MAVSECNVSHTPAHHPVCLTETEDVDHMRVGQDVCACRQVFISIFLPVAVSRICAEFRGEMRHPKSH